MQVFEKILMASEDVKSYLGTGVYEDSGVKAIHDGAVVVVGDLRDHDAYQGMKDINTRTLNKPTAITDKVAFVDYVGVSEVDVMGNIYRVGDKVCGLVAPAGAKVRYRIPQVGDMFWLAEGNFVSKPTVGEYAKTTASDTRLTAASTQDEDGATYVKIEATKPLVMGTVEPDTLYMCRVVAVA